MSRAVDVMHSHKSWEWSTPDDLYHSLNEEFRFNWDPCPLGGDVDGSARLLNSWDGKRVFCNPPYGPEIRKFLECWKDAELAVYLIPARTDTRWFHDICLPYATEIRFIKGRLKFGGCKDPAPFPSMVVVFDNTRPRRSESDFGRLLGWQDSLREEAMQAKEQRA